MEPPKRHVQCVLVTFWVGYSSGSLVWNYFPVIARKLESGEKVDASLKGKSCLFLSRTGIMKTLCVLAFPNGRTHKIPHMLFSLLPYATNYVFFKTRLSCNRGLPAFICYYYFSISPWPLTFSFPPTIPSILSFFHTSWFLLTSFPSSIRIRKFIWDPEYVFVCPLYI